MCCCKSYGGTVNITIPPEGQIEDGTHDRGVDIGRLRQALQRERHQAMALLSRGGVDLRENEEEAGEEGSERKTELHRAGEKVAYGEQGENGGPWGG